MNDENSITDRLRAIVRGMGGLDEAEEIALLSDALAEIDHLRMALEETATEIRRLRRLCLNMGGKISALRAALSDSEAITYPPHVNIDIHRPTIAEARAPLNLDRLLNGGNWPVEEHDDLVGDYEVTVP